MCVVGEGIERFWESLFVQYLKLFYTPWYFIWILLFSEDLQVWWRNLQQRFLKCHKKHKRMRNSNWRWEEKKGARQRTSWKVTFCNECQQNAWYKLLCLCRGEGGTRRLPQQPLRCAQLHALLTRCAWKLLSKTFPRLVWLIYKLVRMSTLYLFWELTTSRRTDSSLILARASKMA